MREEVKLDLNNIPKHVAIIMDGNRRWAVKRSLEPAEGHRVGAEKTIEPIVDRAIELGIKFLTFWAFSTENWKRDKSELKVLFEIFRKGLREETKKLQEKGVRLRILGDITKFPKDIAKTAVERARESAGNKKITVAFALNYGGRPEILRAVKKIINEKVPSGKLTEEFFSTHLDTAGMPDPDLIIRTGGELRLSGLMPWQAIYAELYFTPTLWPDFGPEEFDKAILEFQKRQRRFGK